MKENIKAVLDLGLEVSNKIGGYMLKEDSDRYLFQSEVRASNYGNFDDMTILFLEESEL